LPNGVTVAAHREARAGREVRRRVGHDAGFPSIRAAGPIREAVEVERDGAVVQNVVGDGDAEDGFEVKADAQRARRAAARDRDPGAPALTTPPFPL
jgi:hypothetical protein